MLMEVAPSTSRSFPTMAASTRIVHVSAAPERMIKDRM
jgi:hypothetical protein